MASSKIFQNRGVTLAVLISLLVATSAAPANFIESDQPWLSPCSRRDQGAKVSVPVGILRGLTIPKAPHWEEPSKFAFHALNFLSNSEDLVGDLLNYMVHNHFGGNGSHVTDLGRLVVDDFNLDIDSLTGTAMESLAEMYEMLVRATIFLEVMREDLASESFHVRTHKEEKVATALDSLARGGWDGDIHRESGFYQILCHLYAYLSANGRIMLPNHLDRNIIPAHLRDPTSRAERHNRDYVVLNHMKKMFPDLRQGLVKFHRGMN